MRRWPCYSTIVCAFAIALFVEYSFGQSTNDTEAPDSAVPEENRTDDLGPIETPRELFSALGMTADQFAKFKDGTSLSENQIEPILQALHALSQFPADKIHRWTKRNISTAQLQADADKQRGELIHLSGRLTKVGVFEVPAEMGDRFDISLVRRCEVALASGGKATVLTQSVPRDLHEGDAVSFDGVFLKTTDSQDSEPAALVFASQRLAWHPTTDLGKLGMDVGLLDNLSQNQPISGDEAAAFYQMLGAVGQASLKDLLAATRGQQWTVIPPISDQNRQEIVLKKLEEKNPSLQFYLVSEPEKYTGKLMAFEGQVYRCVRVSITNRELAARLGFDHYYNLVLFIDLDYKLTLGPADVAADKADGGRPIPTEVKTYPVSACVRELPLGFPMGDKLKERVRVPGYFFKQWPFRSTSAAVLHPNRPERSPLVIGPGLQWLSKPQPANSQIQVIISGAFVMLLALLCLVLWRASRRDRKFRTEVFSKDREATSESLFDESAIKAAVEGNDHT